MRLTDRELATILHGLRCVQEQTTGLVEIGGFPVLDRCLHSGMTCDHFAGAPCLTEAEIEDLCVRLNETETQEQHQAADPHCTCNDCMEAYEQQTQPVTCPVCGEVRAELGAHGTCPGAICAKTIPLGPFPGEHDVIITCSHPAGHTGNHLGWIPGGGQRSWA